jgi:hypothetical protein
MEKHWLARLKQLVEDKRIVVLRFDEDEWERLRESRRGISEFTVARHHTLLEDAKFPTACLIIGHGEDSEELCFGLISSRSAVTTLDSRINVKRVVKIRPQSESELLKLVTQKPHKKNLKERLGDGSPVVTLSPKLSSHLLERLASISHNRSAMRAVAESFSSPKYFRDAPALQEDALHVALKAFGLGPEDRAQSLELVADQETALARVGIMEDSVIEHDARHISGYALVDSHVTGRAFFERGTERLEVFTANRRPLERVFGVDLIYWNASRQSIVMLQYKMLEPFRGSGEETDWIYRPDSKLDSEIKRMRKFSANHPAGPYEYRLNPGVFYLKFVKRDGSLRKASIITPLDHFEKLSQDPACRGPKNGLRVSYNSLSGRYLRENAFLDLVRSGYIGAHADTTKQLMVLVETVLNNERAVVAAIQRPIETRAIGDDEFDGDEIDDFLE